MNFTIIRFSFAFNDLDPSLFMNPTIQPSIFDMGIRI